MLQSNKEWKKIIWSEKCPSGMCLIGEMSVGEVSVGEVSVGEVSGRGNVSGGTVRTPFLRPGSVLLKITMKAYFCYCHTLF